MTAKWHSYAQLTLRPKHPHQEEAFWHRFCLPMRMAIKARRLFRQKQAQIVTRSEEQLSVLEFSLFFEI